MRCFSRSPKSKSNSGMLKFHCSPWAFTFAFLAVALLLQGCQSYTIVQTNVFADDDGNVITVDYGRSESDHVNTFIAPTNGKEMEFRSKLMVRVTLPGGDRFKAWQCMNFRNTGTMYKTDNDRWKFLANGFSSVVYRQNEDDENRYDEVFRGVLCDIADREVKKDERWKVVPKDQGTYKKPKQ